MPPEMAPWPIGLGKESSLATRLGQVACLLPARYW
jgi:hypothetical protein